MVPRYFKLREQPFGVTPDPRYFYASATHREALSSLLYGIESGLGFVALTAVPGMGKTTLLFDVLRRLGETSRTVFLFQSISTSDDLVRALLIDLGVTDIKGNHLVEMQAQLNQVLVAQYATGKRLVVAIDEAQNLSQPVLEAIRMLSNFETARDKLMQIILAGQPQLAETLAQPEMLQLRQRISIFSYLKPLSHTETSEYIRHRLKISGCDSPDSLFTNAAVAAIALHSQGIPRNINNICFNALSIGCALQRTKIDDEIIREVVADLEMQLPVASTKHAKLEANEEANLEKFVPTPLRSARSRTRVRLIASAGFVLVILISWLLILTFRTFTIPGLTSRGLTGTAFAIASAPAPTETRSSEQPKLGVLPAVDSRVVHAQQILPEGQITETPTPRTAAHGSASRRTRLILVQEGQSLSQICARNFGACSPQLLCEIIKLNSSITNPDHIESGQRLSLPILKPISQDKQDSSRARADVRGARG
jgi:type II secretory pathway predicted ATPase ExeA